jgi:hypothetical protein
MSCYKINVLGQGECMLCPVPGIQIGYFESNGSSIGLKFLGLIRPCRRDSVPLY